MNKKKIGVIVTVFILLGTSIYFYMSNQNNTDNDEVSRTREYQVINGDIISSIDSVGKIKLEEIKHNFSDSVILEKIFVKEGQQINLGDKIASISTKEVDKKIIELNNLLNETTIKLEQAKDLQKNQRLETDAYKNEINNIKKDIEQQQKLKKNPVLYSKSSGVVLSIGYEENARTVIENPIAIVGSLDEIYAQIAITQNDILKISKNQKVYLQLVAYEDDKITGKVKEISLKPNEDAGSTSYKVTVKLDPTDKQILEGMTVSGQFIIKELKNVTKVSNKAIKLSDGKQVVNLKNEDGTTKEITIQTGFSDGKFSEVIDGLKDGDIVVVEG